MSQQLIINGEIYTVPNLGCNYWKEKSDFLHRYFSVEWRIRDPIVIEHAYFDIYSIDIQQALDIIINEKVETKITNIVVVSHILEYLIANMALSLLAAHITEHKSLYKPWLLFLYDYKLITKELKTSHIQKLLATGAEFDKIVDFLSRTAIVNPYAYYENITHPIEPFIKFEEEKCDTEEIDQNLMNDGFLNNYGKSNVQTPYEIMFPSMPFPAMFPPAMFPPAMFPPAMFPPATPNSEISFSTMLPHAIFPPAMFPPAPSNCGISFSTMLHPETPKHETPFPSMLQQETSNSEILWSTMLPPVTANHELLFPAMLPTVTFNPELLSNVIINNSSGLDVVPNYQNMLSTEISSPAINCIDKTYTTIKTNNRPSNKILSQKSIIPTKIDYLTFDEILTVSTGNCETRNCETGNCKTENNETGTNENVLVTEDIAKTRLSDWIKGTINDITWENVVLAGYGLFQIVNNKHHEISNTPIELYIYGNTSEDRELCINKILQHLPEHVVFEKKNKNKLLVIIRNQKIPVYIVDSGVKTVSGVLRMFPVTLSHIAYDGDNFLVDGIWMKSIMSKTTFSYSNIIHLHELDKYCNNGIGMLINKKCEFKGEKLYNNFQLFKLDLNTESSIVKKKEQYILWKAEPIQRLQILIKCLFSCDYSLINTHCASDKIKTSSETSEDCFRKISKTISNHTCIPISDKIAPVNIEQFFLSDKNNNLLYLELSNVKILKIFVNSPNVSNLGTKVRKSRGSIIIEPSREQIIQLKKIRDIFQSDDKIRKLLKNSHSRKLNLRRKKYVDRDHSVPIKNNTLLIKFTCNDELFYQNNISLPLEHIVDLIKNTTVITTVIVKPYVHLINVNKLDFPLIMFCLHSLNIVD
jgi:hypothetical protein